MATIHAEIQRVLSDELDSPLAVAPDDRLADPFGGAHDSRRVYGLVGGDEHEAFDATEPRGLRDIVRSHDVGLDRLAR